MIDFYNAFISYRHAPLDSAIAERIQKKLEHFHVPHALRKKLKHPKITRIFRDKDELPITSDLTETITEALEKAEYLIVICSTNTKESIWVKREIQTFLKTHTKDKVLTVLCNGEPQDVIPEELLTEEREYVDANGFIHKVSQAIEPLSCDYRMSRSKADKEELPRLASALLGCSYDELQRRRRQYRLRRASIVVAAVMAVLIGFGCYMSVVAKKIDNSYIDSLRSRSLFLANESKQLMEDGRRTDAVLLALEALPKDKSDKTPLTGEAIRALTDSAGVYESACGNLSYEAVWNYKANNPVIRCIMTDDESMLAALDRSGYVYCWDTRTHVLLFEQLCDIAPVDIILMENDSILIVYKTYVEAYNIDTGEMIWDYYATAAELAEGDVIYEGNMVCFDKGSGKLVMLSPRDGSEEYVFELKTDDLLNDIYFVRISPDGTKFTYSDSNYIWNEDQKINVVDIATGNTESIYLDCGYIAEISFIDNDHICIIGDTDIYTSSASWGTGYSILQPGTKQFYCYDTSFTNGWVAELEYTDVSRGAHSFYISSRNAVMFYVGNTAAIYDLETGEPLNHYDVGSSIISVDDWNENGHPEIMCQNGDYIFTTSDTTDTMASFSFIDTPIDEGLIGETLFVLPDDSTDIIAYGHNFQGTGWEPVSSYSGFYTGNTYQAFYSDEDYLIIVARITDTEILRVSVIDINENELVFSDDLEDMLSTYPYYNIEKSGDNYYAYIGYDVYLIDIDKEKVVPTEYHAEYKDSISNGMFITLDISTSEMVVEVTDIEEEEGTYIETDDYNDLDWSMVGNCVYVEAVDTVFIPMGNRVFAANLDEEEIEEIDVPAYWRDDYLYTFHATAADDGSYILLSDGSTVIVVDDTYEEQYILRTNSEYRFGAAFKDDILYIAEDYYLVLYDSKTGEMLSRHEMTLYTNGEAVFTFRDEASELYIQTYDQICIFETENWVEIASITDVYCYHEATDRFFTFSFTNSGECKPGFIKHYTVDELIEKGYEFLNGHELDEVLRQKYGL